MGCTSIVHHHGSWILVIKAIDTVIPSAEREKPVKGSWSRENVFFFVEEGENKE